MKMNREQQIYARYLSSCPENPLRYRLSSCDEHFLMFEAYFSHAIPQKKRAKILDLGCGSGAFVSRIQSKGYKSVGGIDMSPEQIDAGKEYGVENLRRGDALPSWGTKRRSMSLFWPMTPKGDKKCQVK